MSEDVTAFPLRFRGYDREAVDRELHELRAALDFAHAERDRAVARALSVENGDQANAQTSATVQWLITTAEQDAQRIRAEAHAAAAEHVERAEELLRHRIELIEQAQHEADVCRAQAAEEARTIIQEALEKAGGLLRGLQESEEGLRGMFDSGILARRMPPPRISSEQTGPIAIPVPVPEPVAPQSTAPRHSGRQTELDPK
jgi:F0F1-type ATP synthase membrane subunit b/b'